MGLRGAVAAMLCAFCIAASLPAISMPASADDLAPGEPQVKAPDAHRRQAVWTFPGPAGYFLYEVRVNAGWVELSINKSTGSREPFGTVTTADFQPPDTMSWDSIETDSDVPEPCRLSLYVSTNGGEGWYQVPQNGSLQGANAAGGKIRVRSELRTSDNAATPVLRSLWLSFTVNQMPDIISLNCSKGAFVYKREQSVISSRVVDSDGDPVSYEWDQTEGTDARLGRTDQSSLTFTPIDNGPHTFRLRVSDGFGVSPWASITVSVMNHAPTVSFEMEGLPYKNTQVHIIATAFSSEGSLANFDWRIVSAPPFTTMVQPTKPDIVLYSFYTGPCTISLTVTDDQGTPGTGNFTFDFIGHPPKAALSCDKNDAHAGQVYTFDASRSSDPDGDRLQYRFDFGDGETTDWVYFSDIEHSFQRTGYYTVRVRARDVDGLVSDAQYPVHVKPRNQPPVAGIQVTPGDLDTPFQFVSTSGDQDGSVAWIDWDFGDGSTATGAAVSHRFGLPGNYTVRLWVRDDDGESSSTKAFININRPPALVSLNPPGDFALGPGQGFNLSVEAMDPDGDALSYSWSVNGEQLTSETTNAHRFVPGGQENYDITVFVDDGRGGGTNYTWNLTIMPTPGPAPEPVYTLLAIIIVALLAQGVYLSSIPIRGWARRRKQPAGAAGAYPAVAKHPAERSVPDAGLAARTERPVPGPLPASRETSPLEWSPEPYSPEVPPGIPPPELTLPAVLPMDLPPPALPPEAEPMEAQPVLEELPDPEPLAQILGPAERPRPYRRTPPPF